MSPKTQDILRAILKFIGLISLVFIAIASTFPSSGASITPALLILCALIFLFSMFSEIKNWEIWGLIKGENKEDLSKVPQGDGISETSVKIDKKDIAEAEKKPLVLMPANYGNFLVLAFEIERLLRILASVVLKKNIFPQANLKQLVSELNEKGIVTDNGKAQIDAVTRLRNLIVHGRSNEIDEETLSLGITIAFNFYSELFNWLNNPQNTNGNK